MQELESIEDLLYHINTLSGAALNAIPKNMDNPYIKRRLIHAKREIKEAYLRIMDLKR